MATEDDFEYVRPVEEREMTDGGRHLVIINSDWILETAGRRTFGQCIIRVSPPHDNLNFKRGFTLINPTDQRCALFSMILALETVSAIESPENLTDYAIATKHGWVHSTITSGLIDKWEGMKQWPKGSAHMKLLLLRARDLYKELNAPDSTRPTIIVHIPREEGDKHHVELLSEDGEVTTDGQIDADAILKKGGSKSDIEKAMRDLRMRTVMINELLSSGARGSRRVAKTSKKDK